MRQWFLRLFVPTRPPARDRGDFDFRAPVGTVNAPQTQILNILSAGLATAADPKVRLAPTLVNRGPQEAAVKKCLDALCRQRGPVLPLLVVLPARPTDFPDAFVTRFALHDLKGIIPRDVGSLHLGRLPWPSGHPDVSAVISTVRDGLGLPTHFDRPEMEAWLTKTPASLCFSHTVDRRDWEIDEGALIKRWVDYVCEAWPPSPQGRLVVAFLTVELPTPPSLDVYLAELREQAKSTLRLVVTPEMEPIRRKHIEEWIGLCCRLLRDEYLAADLQPAPHRLFAEADRPERPFQEVYDELIIIWREVRGSPASKQPLVGR